MTTTQRDKAEHSEANRRRGCCGGHGHGHGHDTAAGRRRALEERHCDLEQELADVTEQLHELPAEDPSASE